MCNIGLHVALANLLSEIIMVRGGFLSLPTWFSRDHIDDVIIQCLCLGLVLSFTVFIVLTVYLSVMYFMYDVIINNNNHHNNDNKPCQWKTQIFRPAGTKTP